MTRPLPETMSTLFERNFKVLMSGVHTALPGQILEYDGSRAVTVQPMVSKKLTDGTYLKLPKIVDVPLIFPGSTQGVFRFPIKKGDGVLLVFSERSIEEWMNSGKVGEPEDIRRFSLSDAIAIPGLFFREQEMPLTEISITEADRLLLKNQTTDLLTVLTGLIDVIAGLTTVGSASAQAIDPTSIAALNSYKLTVQSLLTASG